MTKNPYRAITDKYPVDRLPPELLRDLKHNGYVRVILQQLDDQGEVVDGHSFLDRAPGEPADPDDIVDYVRWMRGHI